ncbi:MAG: methylmalonyl-CoA mutase, partial [Acidobacteriota bacterium]|nr:methylmalonyl-CoA mutase [Acidobacteriota bacterium]
GAHNVLLPEVAKLLKSAGADDVLLFAGGIVPDQDIAGLKDSGVDEIFRPGATTTEIVEYLNHRLGVSSLASA